jgi:osmoprotectant transport system substrate-binding protein
MRRLPPPACSPPAGLAVLAAACNGDDADTAAPDTDGAGRGRRPDDGPTIDVSSFNFPESEILGEIYAQALEDAGYPVDRTLNLGARELIYPDLLDGEISLVPEYLGSALVVWFEQDPPADVDSGLSRCVRRSSPRACPCSTRPPRRTTRRSS